MGPSCTLVCIGTIKPRARVPGVTSASKRTRCVGTGRYCIAVMSLERAFIVIGARNSIANKTSVARARK